MIVVDASVLVDALTSDDGLHDAARAELGRDTRWSAPQHFPAEVFSGVRGRLLGGETSAARGRDAVAALATTQIDLVEVAPLLERMWELRAGVPGYDAVHVTSLPDADRTPDDVVCRSADEAGASIIDGFDEHRCVELPRTHVTWR